MAFPGFGAASRRLLVALAIAGAAAALPGQDRADDDTRYAEELARLRPGPLGAWLDAQDVPALETLRARAPSPSPAPDPRLREARAAWDEAASTGAALAADGELEEALRTVEAGVDTLLRALPEGARAGDRVLHDALARRAALRTTVALPEDELARVRAAWTRQAEVERAYAARDFARARALLAEQLPAWRSLGPPGERLRLQTLSSLASVQEVDGAWRDAERIWRALLEGALRTFGAEHAHTWRWGQRLAAALAVNGSLDAAERLQRLVLARRTELLGADSAEATADWSSLGRILRQRGALADAEACLRRSVALHEAAEVPAYERALAWVSLTRTLRQQGRYAEALSTCDESARWMREAVGEGHFNLATIRNDRCNILQRMGDTRGAVRDMREVVAAYERLLGAEHPFTVDACGGLASMLADLGEYAEAEALARRSLDGLRERFGRSARTAGALSRLGSILHDKGDVERAEPLVAQALEIERERLGADHPKVLRSELNHAQVLARLGEHERGQRLVLRALEAIRAREERNERDVAFALRVSGDVHGQAGDTGAAIARYREALDLRHRLLGDHPDTFATAFALGAALREAGELDEAGERLREAVAMAGRLEGTDRPRYPLALAELGRVLLESGKPDAGADALAASLEHLEERRRSVAGGERERALFHARLGLRGIAAGAVRARIELGQLERALEAAERGRGRVLLDLLERSEHDLVTEAESRGARGLADLSERETAARAERIEAEERVAATPDDAQAHAALGRARAALRDAEARVLSALVDVWPAARPADQEAIRAALGPRDALLLFEWSTEEVCVLVVPGGDAPLLGRVAARGRDACARLEALARDWRRGLAAPPARRAADADPAAASAALRDALLPAEVRAALVGHDTWVVATGGPLDGLPVETWARERGASAVRVPSGTVLARATRGGAAASPGRDARRPDRAVVLGDPALALTRADVSGARPVEASSALEQARLFGALLEPLPASGAEARRVAEQLAEGGLDVELLLGAEASLPRLEEAVRGARLVHLATHGLVGSRSRPYDASLALATPETAGPDDFGFLTLEHLFRRWRGRLSGCELVVLSACDGGTAAGAPDVEMSLPWGFLYAGARRVVASLWKVDDEATALLMARFHANLTAEPALDAPAALDEAQRWLRGADRREVRRARAALGLDADRLVAASRDGATNAPREDAGPEPVDAGELRPYADPYYWSAFVLIGPPR